MLTNFLLEFWSVWVRFLLNFASKLEGRGSQKNWKTIVLKHFCYFGQLANKRPYDWFFNQLGPQLGTQNPSKTFPRGSQNQQKINQKQRPRYDPFFYRFSRFWRPIGPQVGTMLGLCWPQNPQKGDFENNTKKTLKKQMAKTRKKILEIQIWGSWGPLIIQKTTLSRPQGVKTRPHS